MAGRSFARHSNGPGHRVRAEHINELQAAAEADDARLDALGTQVQAKANASTVADLSSRVSAIELGGGGGGTPITNIDGGAPDSEYGG